jgi:hypothetical protein
MGSYFQRQTLEGPHKSEVILNGKFNPNGSSNPTSAMIFGNWIASVAHSATGKWTITMKTPFKGAAGWHSCQVSLGSSTDQPEVSVRHGAIDLSAGTIVVFASDEDDTSGISAAADIAYDAATFISVSLSVKYDKVPDGSGLV